MDKNITVYEFCEGKKKEFAERWGITTDQIELKGIRRDIVFINRVTNEQERVAI